MKTPLLILSLLFYCSFSFGQNAKTNDGSGKVLIDNDELKVVQFESNPQENVCGKGKHHHDAHLTVALTDTRILIISEDGKKQEAEIPAGVAIWFDAGTHSAINDGTAPAKVLLIYPQK